MDRELIYARGDSVTCCNPQCGRVVCRISRDVYSDETPTCGIFCDWERDDPILDDREGFAREKCSCVSCGEYWLAPMMMENDKGETTLVILVHTRERGWGYGYEMSLRAGTTTN